MRVHVQDDLFISADGRQYTLERRSVTQTGDNAGKEVYSSIGYYASLQGAVNAIVKLKIAESQVSTLKELLVKLDEIRSDIKTAITV